MTHFQFGLQSLPHRDISSRCSDCAKTRKGRLMRMTLSIIGNWMLVSHSIRLWLSDFRASVQRTQRNGDSPQFIEKEAFLWYPNKLRWDQENNSSIGFESIYYIQYSRSVPICKSERSDKNYASTQISHHHSTLWEQIIAIRRQIGCPNHSLHGMPSFPGRCAKSDPYCRMHESADLLEGPFQVKCLRSLEI
jgi:hypothetical protein